MNLYFAIIQKNEGWLRESKYALDYLKEVSQPMEKLYYLGDNDRKMSWKSTQDSFCER